MAKKVYLSPSDQTTNAYAYGNTTEAIQCGKIAEACKAALERSGVEVMVGQYDTMANRCKASDAFGANLHVPIHTNAYNGKVSGTRMFCYNSNGEGYRACKSIFNVLAPLTPGKSENISVNAKLFEVRVPRLLLLTLKWISTMFLLWPSGLWSTPRRSVRPSPKAFVTIWGYLSKNQNSLRIRLLGQQSIECR